jgi:hypothetical protein
MFAKNLEHVLAEALGKSDVSPIDLADIAERFESLRGYGRLPRARANRATPLSFSEIAAAILSLVASNAKWAGHAVAIIGDLRPVGGAAASFHGVADLSAAIEYLLSDSAAREGLVSLTVSAAESAMNCNGFAALIYRDGAGRRRTSFVSKMAVSQLQAGADKVFDEDCLHAPASRCVVFGRAFFDHVAEAVLQAAAFPGVPAGDGSEYDAEEAKQTRYKALGVRTGSRFLNVGVDTQVTWPKQEMLVQFDRHQLVLMPKTKEKTQSVHMDLVTNRITNNEALTIINRFLSMLAWRDDQFAVAQDGWSGNPVPVAVPRRDLAFTTAHQWVFDGKIPANDDVTRALAVYREARNAQQNYMVSYAVLNYYKVVEIGHKGRGDVKNWFRDNFDFLRQQNVFRDEFENFAKICSGEQPHEYIYEACRIAVAHAGKDSKSDPDNANELVRLHTAANVLRIFARHFIAKELNVAEDGSSV